MDKMGSSLAPRLLRAAAVVTLLACLLDGGDAVYNCPAPPPNKEKVIRISIVLPSAEMSASKPHSLVAYNQLEKERNNQDRTTELNRFWNLKL